MSTKNLQVVSVNPFSYEDGRCNPADLALEIYSYYMFLPDLCIRIYFIWGVGFSGGCLIQRLFFSPRHPICACMNIVYTPFVLMLHHHIAYLQ